MVIESEQVKIQEELADTGVKERSMKDLLFNPKLTPTILVPNVSKDMGLEDVIGADMVQTLEKKKEATAKRFKKDDD